MRLLCLSSILVLTGCAAVNSSYMGKKVRVTKTEIGLRDPFFVVAKDIYPESKPDGFGFPMLVIFNSNVYDVVSIDHGDHMLRNLTEHRETTCSIEGSGGGDATASKPASLVFPLKASPVQTSGGDNQASGKASVSVSERPRKEVLRLWCPGLKPATGSDFQLELNVTQTQSEGAEKGAKKTSVSIPFTVSYNGWLVSLLGGIGLSTGFIYLGYLRASP